MITLDTAIDMAMKLPIEKRLSLVDFIKRRTIDDIRSRIADEAVKTRQVFRNGDLQIGTVDDLMESMKKDERI